MELAENWQDIPCQNDHAAFDPEKIVVTMLSQGLDVNMMSLPNDGVIFLDNNAKLGRKGEFQCEKRAKPEDAFFIGGTTYLNYYDPANWESRSKSTRPRLHAQLVPGSQDKAVFKKPKPVQVQINQVVKVGQLFFGGVVSL
uniref:Protein amnionless n=1 Tax=Steinernema glaseri TaxID=37863 RepID=A0A1I8AAD0_9BILA